MTKSTITREESIQAVFDLKVGYTLGLADIEILKRVARMALAAMDSESGCLPLNYLQGHKDGLELAAQLAEANHPETGDWLYDDPIELAKAIRKGPDMPPAQPAPVVSAELLHTAASAIEDLLTTKDRTGACVWFDLPFRLRSAANAQPAPVELANIALPHSWLDGEGVEVMSANEVKRACRAAMLHAGNSPVVPDERAAFNAWNNDVDCPLAGRDAKSAAWLAWQSRAAMLAADPKLPGSDPATVPDNSAITQHFDTIALEAAREIMCDVNRRHEFLGGEIQLLSRIQCRIDDACRAAMLSGGKS